MRHAWSNKISNRMYRPSIHRTHTNRCGKCSAHWQRWGSWSVARGCTQRTAARKKAVQYKKYCISEAMYMRANLSCIKYNVIYTHTRMRTHTHTHTHTHAHIIQHTPHAHIIFCMHDHTAPCMQQTRLHANYSGTFNSKRPFVFLRASYSIYTATNSAKRTRTLQLFNSVQSQ